MAKIKKNPSVSLLIFVTVWVVISSVLLVGSNHIGQYWARLLILFFTILFSVGSTTSIYNKDISIKYPYLLFIFLPTLIMLSILHIVWITEYIDQTDLNIYYLVFLIPFVLGLIFTLLDFLSGRDSLKNEDIYDKNTFEILTAFDSHFIDDIRNLSEKEDTEILRAKLYSVIRYCESKSDSRIRHEISSLANRANLNLIIGIILIVSGLVVLASSFTWSPKESSNDWPSFFMMFIPRFSLAMLIEISSFYFLAIYRRTLTETKYYQNELTNIELKFLALKSSFFREELAMFDEILVKISSIERNHILKKDETTEEVEKQKANTSLITGLLSNMDKLNDIIESTNKKST